MGSLGHQNLSSACSTWVPREPLKRMASPGRANCRGRSRRPAAGSSKKSAALGSIPGLPWRRRPWSGRRRGCRSSTVNAGVQRRSGPPRGAGSSDQRPSSSISPSTAMRRTGGSVGAARRASTARRLGVGVVAVVPDQRCRCDGCARRASCRAGRRATRPAQALGAMPKTPATARAASRFITA